MNYRQRVIDQAKEAGVSNVFKKAQESGEKISQQTIYNFTWGHNVRIETIELIDKLSKKVLELE